MRYATTKLVLSVVLCLAFSWGSYPGIIQAEGDHHEQGEPGHGDEAEGHAHDKAGRHGGQVTMTKEFHFEVLFHYDSVQVYLYDGKQDPISAEGVTGNITFSFRDQSQKRFIAELAYTKPVEEEEEHHEGKHGHSEEEKEENHAQDFLQAKVDLNKMSEGDMKAMFVLKNLPGQKEKEVDFKETFKLAGSEEPQGKGGHHEKEEQEHHH